MKIHCRIEKLHSVSGLLVTIVVAIIGEELVTDIDNLLLVMFQHDILYFFSMCDFIL